MLTSHTKFSMCMRGVLQFQLEIRAKHNHHQVYCEEDIVHEVCQCEELEFSFSGKFFLNFLISPHLCYLLTNLIPDL